MHMNRFSRFTTRVYPAVQDRFLSVMTFTSILLLVACCSGLSRNPVPFKKMDEAVVTGMPGVRAYWVERETNPLTSVALANPEREETVGFCPVASEEDFGLFGVVAAGHSEPDAEFDHVGTCATVVVVSCRGGQVEAVADVFDTAALACVE